MPLNLAASRCMLCARCSVNAWFLVISGIVPGYRVSGWKVVARAVVVRAADALGILYQESMQAKMAIKMDTLGKKLTGLGV